MQILAKNLHYRKFSALLSGIRRKGRYSSIVKIITESNRGENAVIENSIKNASQYGISQLKSPTKLNVNNTQTSGSIIPKESVPNFRKNDISWPFPKNNTPLREKLPLYLVNKSLSTSSIVWNKKPSTDANTTKKINPNYEYPYLSKIFGNENLLMRSDAYNQALIEAARRRAALDGCKSATKELKNDEFKRPQVTNIKGWGASTKNIRPGQELQSKNSNLSSQPKTNMKQSNKTSSKDISRQPPEPWNAGTKHLKPNLKSEHKVSRPCPPPIKSQKQTESGSLPSDRFIYSKSKTQHEFSTNLRSPKDCTAFAKPPKQTDSGTRKSECSKSADVCGPYKDSVQYGFKNATHSAQHYSGLMKNQKPAAENLKSCQPGKALDNINASKTAESRELKQTEGGCKKDDPCKPSDTNKPSDPCKEEGEKLQKRKEEERKKNRNKMPTGCVDPKCKKDDKCKTLSKGSYKKASDRKRPRRRTSEYVAAAKRLKGCINKSDKKPICEGKPCDVQQNVVFDRKKRPLDASITKLCKEKYDESIKHQRKDDPVPSKDSCRPTESLCKKTEESSKQKDDSCISKIKDSCQDKKPNLCESNKKDAASPSKKNDPSGNSKQSEDPSKKKFSSESSKQKEVSSDSKKEPCPCTSRTKEPNREPSKMSSSSDKKETLKSSNLNPAAKQDCETSKTSTKPNCSNLKKSLSASDVPKEDAKRGCGTPKVSKSCDTLKEASSSGRPRARKSSCDKLKAYLKHNPCKTCSNVESASQSTSKAAASENCSSLKKDTKPNCSNVKKSSNVLKAEPKKDICKTSSNTEKKEAASPCKPKTDAKRDCGRPRVSKSCSALKKESKEDPSKAISSAKEKVSNIAAKRDCGRPRATKSCAELKKASSSAGTKPSSTSDSLKADLQKDPCKTNSNAGKKQTACPAPPKTAASSDSGKSQKDNSCNAKDSSSTLRITKEELRKDPCKDNANVQKKESTSKSTCKAAKTENCSTRQKDTKPNCSNVKKSLSTSDVRKEEPKKDICKTSSNTEKKEAASPCKPKTDVKRDCGRPRVSKSCSALKQESKEDPSKGIASAIENAPKIAAKRDCGRPRATRSCAELKKASSSAGTKPSSTSAPPKTAASPDSGKSKKDSSCNAKDSSSTSRITKEELRKDPCKDNANVQKTQATSQSTCKAAKTENCSTLQKDTKPNCSNVKKSLSTSDVRKEEAKKDICKSSSGTEKKEAASPCKPKIDAKRDCGRPRATKSCAELKKASSSAAAKPSNTSDSLKADLQKDPCKTSSNAEKKQPASPAPPKTTASSDSGKSKKDSSCSVKDSSITSRITEEELRKDPCKATANDQKKTSSNQSTCKAARSENCGTPKRDTKPNCSNIKKSFSTLSTIANQSLKDMISHRNLTTLPTIRQNIFMRKFSSKSKDNGNEDEEQLGRRSKCKSVLTTVPKNRKPTFNPHPNDRLRQCYPTYDMDCKKLCKNAQKTACKKYASLKEEDNTNKHEGKDPK